MEGSLYLHEKGHEEGQQALLHPLERSSETLQETTATGVLRGPQQWHPGPGGSRAVLRAMGGGVTRESRMTLTLPVTSGELLGTRR